MAQRTYDCISQSVLHYLMSFFFFLYTLKDEDSQAARQKEPIIFNVNIQKCNMYTCILDTPNYNLVVQL